MICISDTGDKTAFAMAVAPILLAGPDDEMSGVRRIREIACTATGTVSWQGRGVRRMDKPVSTRPAAKYGRPKGGIK